MRTYDSGIRARDHERMMRTYVRTFPAVSLFKRVSGERETSGGGRETGRRMSVRHSVLHDTYFYARSFAPAYGRARATRIDEARPVV